jgi:hypothetical protein
VWFCFGVKRDWFGGGWPDILGQIVDVADFERRCVLLEVEEAR